MNRLQSCRTSMHRIVWNMLSPSGHIRWRQLCCVSVGVGIGWVGGAIGQPELTPTRRGIHTAVPTVDTVTDATQLASRTPTNVPARRTSGITDTGDYAPGHRSFERYTVPLLCVVAARTEAGYARRTATIAAAAYTLQHTAPEQDTLPATVIHVARTCGARFLDQPVSHMAAANLPALFELALLARQDTLAQAILVRSVALAPTNAARQQMWLDGLDTLLHAEPARVATALALVADWNRLGRSAIALQLRGVARLLAFWQQRFDRARMREGAEALLQLEPDTTQPMSIRIALLNGHLIAYGALWQLAAVEHLDSLAVVGQRVVQDLRRSVWDMPGWQQLPLEWVRTFQSVRHNADALRVWATDESAAFRNLRVDGQPMVPLVAAYGMTSAGVPGRDTVRPIPGRISLFVRPDVACYDESLYDSWGDNACTPTIDRLARWQSMYEKAGLQLTVIGYTSGSALYSGPIPPVAQAHAIAWYVHQFARLPVPVAVQSLGVRRLPAPNGTLKHDDTGAFDRQFKQQGNPFQNALAVLTDRAGRVVYVGPDDAVMLDVLLAHFFAEPSSAPGMATPGSRGGHATTTAPAPSAPVTPVTSVTP
jgi:hypothetical protein